MGGLTSALAPILQVGSAINTIANIGGRISTNKQELKQQEASKALAFQQAQAKAAYDKQQEQLKFLQGETDRRLKLKLSVARQRAQFGGDGISAGDGSGEAVLLGMFNNADIQDNLAKRQTALNLQGNDLSLAQIQQKNLLEQSQLREKQNLKYLTDSF